MLGRNLTKYGTGTIQRQLHTLYFIGVVQFNDNCMHEVNTRTLDWVSDRILVIQQYVKWLVPNVTQWILGRDKMVAIFADVVFKCIFLN